MTRSPNEPMRLTIGFRPTGTPFAIESILGLMYSLLSEQSDEYISVPKKKTDNFGVGYTGTILDGNESTVGAYIYINT